MQLSLLFLILFFTRVCNDNMSPAWNFSLLFGLFVVTNEPLELGALWYGNSLATIRYKYFFINQELQTKNQVIPDKFIVDLM